jgi:hypothetical protein
LGVFEKIYPLNNLLTVQPIFTSNILVDSAQQVEECENIKNVANFIAGEQPGNFHNN